MRKEMVDITALVAEPQGKQHTDYTQMSEQIKMADEAEAMVILCGLTLTARKN